MRTLLIVLHCAASIWDLHAQGHLEYTRHDINGDERFRFSDIAYLPEAHKYYVIPSKTSLHTSSMAIPTP